jgi:hypothetical protein
MSDKRSWALTPGILVVVPFSHPKLALAALQLCPVSLICSSDNYDPSFRVTKDNGHWIIGNSNCVHLKTIHLESLHLNFGFE